jgi:hypothetical protein
MNRRGWQKVVVVLVLAGGIATVGTPASAAEPRGLLGTALDSWVQVNLESRQSEGLVTRLGAWFVQMAKSLTGETDGDPTDTHAGLDPTHSGEATTDPDPGVAGLTSGS